MPTVPLDQVQWASHRTVAGNGHAPSTTGVTQALAGLNLTQQATPPSRGFTLGIEMEFMLSPQFPHHKCDDKTQFALLVVEKYKQYRIDRHKAEPKKPKIFPMRSMVRREGSADQRGHLESDEEASNYWTIQHDASVFSYSKGGARFYGIELVSPILHADMNSDGSSWLYHWTRMNKWLSRWFKIGTRDTCSTHIHVRPSHGYSTASLRHLAMSVLHFEQAFLIFCAEDRRQNVFCRSNWIDNEQCIKTRISRHDAIEKVDKMYDSQELANWMSPTRYHMWNFTNLHGHGAIKTIEFRGGQGCSKNLEAAEGWAAFVLAFVASAMVHGSWTELKQHPRTATGLWSWLSEGVKQAPVVAMDGTGMKWMRDQEEKIDFYRLRNRAKPEHEYHASIEKLLHADEEATKEFNRKLGG